MTAGKAANADNATKATTATSATSATTATKATQDGNGNNIADTYMPKSGGTFTGNITAPSVTGTNGVYDGSSSYRVWSDKNRPAATKMNTSNITVTGTTDTVIEYKFNVNGPAWYRKWSSGWLEQGGTVSIASSVKNNGTYTVTFPTAFVRPDPTVLLTCDGWYDSTYACQIGVTARSANSFTFRLAGSTITSINWYACGLLHM